MATQLTPEQQVEMVKKGIAEILIDHDNRDIMAQAIYFGYEPHFKSIVDQILNLTDQEGNRLLPVRHPEQEVPKWVRSKYWNSTGEKIYLGAQEEMSSYIRVIKE